MFKAFGEGRFVKDPVVKEVGNTRVAKFTLAVNEYRKAKEGAVDGDDNKITSFFDFEAWDTAADVIGKLCQKGTRMLVSAKPRQDSWKDKEDKPHSRILFRVEEFTILDKRKELEPVAATSDMSADDKPF